MGRKIDWTGLAVVLILWAVVVALGYFAHLRGDRPPQYPRNNPWTGDVYDPADFGPPRR